MIPNHSLDDIPIAQPISLNVRVTQSLLQVLHLVLGAQVRHLLEQSRGSSQRSLGNSWAPSSPDLGTWVKETSVSEETTGAIWPSLGFPQGRHPGPTTLELQPSRSLARPTLGSADPSGDLQARSLRPQSSPATSRPSARLPARQPTVRGPLPLQFQPFFRLHAVAVTKRPNQPFCGSPASSRGTTQSSCQSPSPSERRAQPGSRP